MPHLVPDWSGIPANVHALSTVRQGGFSLGPYGDGGGGGGLNLGTHVGDRPEDVARNRALLRACLPAEPAWLTQVHGATVVDAGLVDETTQADACVADRPGQVCVIQTADCLPVLFCEQGGRVVGAAHAGWRGLAAGVLQNTVAAMRDKGAAEIIAWLGPAIGPRCFEVGEDVRQAFVIGNPALEKAFQPRENLSGKYLADIYALARAALSSVGVQRIHGGQMCTVTDSQRFYSYRRDKLTGRMASVVWLE